jgi:hypothetical protein
MRFALPLTLFLCNLAPALVLAQAPAKTSTNTRPDTQADPVAGKIEPKIENIHHEDAGSRINELRVGGETKRITVQPKGDIPPYELGTGSSNRNPATTEPGTGKGGSPGWKVLGF